MREVIRKKYQDNMLNSTFCIRATNLGGGANVRERKAPSIRKPEYKFQPWQDYSRNDGYRFSHL